MTQPSNDSLAETATVTATVTLPLHITVSLGAPAPSAFSPALTPAPDTPAGSGDAARVEPPDPDRADSLREFAEAANLPYFDAAADKEKMIEYYRETDLTNNSDPDSLFDSLSRLLTRTHVNRLAYKPARHLYPWVDLHPDRKLRSLYTADVYEPQQLINEAFALEVEFEARLESLLLADEGEGALPLLEAGPAFNCEHVVPRSWFRGPSFGVRRATCTTCLPVICNATRFAGTSPSGTSRIFRSQS